MGEVGRQFGDQLVGARLVNLGGEMVFKHYVELGSPFDVELVSHDEAAKRYALRVSQAGRVCTEITMLYDRAA